MSTRTAYTVEKQLRAMGAPVFEVGVFDSGNAQKDAWMQLRQWDSDRLLRCIAWLQFQNTEGKHIYVRPNGEHSLSMVDDLTEASLRTMKETGFAPAAIIQTSPGNFQAWLKHEKVLPQSLSTAVAKTLAKQFGGDVKAADWRHFGRLAGFTNRKPKYQQDNGMYPFCRLHSSTGETYPMAGEFVNAIAMKMDQTAAEIAATRKMANAALKTPKQLKSIEMFRVDVRYDGDLSRSELAYAKYAMGNGISRDEVAAAIRTRDLTKHGNENGIQAYIERTLNKASVSLETAAMGNRR